MLLTNYEFKKQYRFAWINRVTNGINWFWLAIVLITNLVIIILKFANLSLGAWLNYFNLALILSSLLINLILSCCLIFNKFDKQVWLLMMRMNYSLEIDSNNNDSQNYNRIRNIQWFTWWHLHYGWIILSSLMSIFISCFSFGFFPWFKTIEPIALSSLILSAINTIWTISNCHFYIVKYWIN